MSSDPHDQETSSDFADPEQGEHGAIECADILRIALVTVAAAVVWFVPRLGWLGIAGVLIGGFPIFAEAYENLRDRRMTMELSMTLALLAALVIREYFTALIITLFVLVAEILEGLTVSRGRQAIADLLQYLPSTALLFVNGEFVECPTRTIGTGDRVLIRPGSRIPVDGVVLSGSSTVEEAAITGEPLPQEKMPARSVFAGTLNQTGAIEVKVERVGKDDLWADRRGRRESGTQSRADPENGGSSRWVSGVFRDRSRAADLCNYTQRALDDFGDHRCRGVRDRSWNAASHSRRSGASCTTGSNHQRRTLP